MQGTFYIPVQLLYLCDGFAIDGFMGRGFTSGGQESGSRLAQPCTKYRL